MTPNEKDNLTRWRADSPAGHQESYFLKLNSPDERRALWVKFTILAPKGRPQATVAETWAIVFDAETHKHVAAKNTFHVSEVTLARTEARLQFGKCELEAGRTRGEVEHHDSHIAWDLSFSTNSKTHHPYPELLYSLPVPKQKAMTPYIDERFHGSFQVGDETIEVDGWKGMQGHNWGSSHTPRYVWAHCNQFQEDDSAWFEAFSGRPKVGPFLVPWLMSAFVSIKGHIIRFDHPLEMPRPPIAIDNHRWLFATRNGPFEFEGEVTCDMDDMVGLYYAAPYGPATHCLNTKIASTEIEVRDRRSGQRTRLTSRSAALEMGTLEIDHGVRMYA